MWLGRALRWPREWWVRQSLRARLTILATTLFCIAVLTGAVLLLILQRYALTRVLDQAAVKTANQISHSFKSGRGPDTVQSATPGIDGIQVVDAHDRVVSATQGGDWRASLVSPTELDAIRDGDRLTVTRPRSEASLRVIGRKVDSPRRELTVLVYTDISRVDDSLRILTRAALIGGPLAVLLMGLASYGVITLSLRPVAGLRHGAADITAARLARQRLPVPRAHDEIHRLAVTLNAMLDRIDAATSRQRTFVGDAAHELRSPLASLRVQLEVGQRLGPSADWSNLIEDVLIDVERLDRLVSDLLTLARLDESGRELTRREPVALDELAGEVVRGYVHPRVPVRLESSPVTVSGDPDALRRVAINLINNAVRYAASEVRVEIGPQARDGRAVAVLTVIDDGPGIPEAERERVFDRFYRLQSSRSRETGGTGLGLPIVRDIARNHGGRVRLLAREDGRTGLRAEVVLPAG